VLHLCCELPLHVVPAELLHERVWVPPPQVTEHELHADQPADVVEEQLCVLQLC